MMRRRRNRRRWSSEMMMMMVVIMKTMMNRMMVITRIKKQAERNRDKMKKLRDAGRERSEYYEIANRQR